MKRNLSSITLLASLASLFVMACGAGSGGDEANSRQGIAGDSARPADSSSSSDPAQDLVLAADESSADEIGSDDRTCWSDADCPDGQTCEGERICPPGALCGPLADSPGTCEDRKTGCDVDGRHYEPGEVFGACDACTCEQDGTVSCRDFACIQCSTDHDCPDGYTCQSDCPPGGLCSPAVLSYCMPAPPVTSNECSAEECPPIYIRNVLCEDGIHYAGPSGRCFRNDEGLCAHEILTCPNCGSLDCAADEICIASIGGAPPSAEDTDSSASDGAETQYACVAAARYNRCAGAGDGTSPGADLTCACLDLGLICEAASCDDSGEPVRVTCARP